MTKEISAASSLKTYNLDWTLKIWENGSNIPWIQTMQKIVKYTVIPLFFITAFELIVKNFLIITFVKSAIATNNSIRTLFVQTQPPLPSPPQRAIKRALTPPNLPLLDTILELEPESPSPPSTRSSSPEHEIHRLEEETPIENREPAAEQSPPSNASLNPVKVTAAAAGVYAIGGLAITTLGFPLVAAGAGATVAGTILAGGALELAPNLFASTRDALYNRAKAVADYFYE